MKTIRSAFSCAVAGLSVVHLRRYQAINGIGDSGAGYVLVAEHCSHETDCPYWAQCPMRDTSRSR
ncbi:hypothetical protein [Burkholderia anthina]|uniref:hypothetical protein n=1 Tax=Burkholderia anthina TaxID=179879 RepID=UPI0029318C43|nr:hypothetical protein [Burkholderia anthina]WJN72105.1 hypothetical protein OH687_38905 [Burkholderia anthina]